MIRLLNQVLEGPHGAPVVVAEDVEGGLGIGAPHEGQAQFRLQRGEEPGVHHPRLAVVPADFLQRLVSR